MKELLWKCTFLDPRFKALHLTADQHSQVVQMLTDESEVVSVEQHTGLQDQSMTETSDSEHQVSF